MEKLRMTSPDLTEANINKLAELFPTVITETIDEHGNPKRAIDFDMLRQELSDHIVEGPQERYQLDWPGKRAAAFAANAPIAKTLRPVREESVNFDTTKNLFIEGDNLEALKLLQESYLGKVKLIYIDPPYNTGNDFVYEDDFAESRVEYLVRSGQETDLGERLVANRETNGRFHSDWLSMMYPRLKLARNLLRADGLIFISIDDNELANLIRLCDEVFGESNYLNTIVWHYGKMSNERSKLPNNHEYVLVYKSSGKGGIFERIKKEDSEYRNRYIRHVTRENTVLYGSVKESVDNLIRLRVKKVMERLGKSQLDDDDVLFDFNQEFKSHSDVIYASTIKGNSEENVKEFDTGQKPLALMNLLLKFGAPEQDAIVLDFFAGSGSTAHSVMLLNSEDGGSRRFIQVQFPEATPEGSAAAQAGFATIADLSRRRITRVGEKLRNEAELNGYQLDSGFRYMKVDTSNQIDVFKTPNDTEQLGLRSLETSIKEDRTAEDLLFQVMLEWDLDLSLPIAVDIIDDCEVYSVDDDALVACFADHLESRALREMAARHPMYAVFRDDAFATDAERINAEQIFREFSPSTMVKTI